MDQIFRQTFVACVEHHASLTSTQDRARTADSEPATELPLLVVADEQTCGRGRGTHRWWTGEGSLAFSLLFDPLQFGIARGLGPRLSLASAVAVIDVLTPLVAGHAIGLHWPNDVYVGGRKISGILIDVLASGRHVLGLGLNSNNSAENAPPELRAHVVTLLDLTGKPQPHTQLLTALLQRLEQVVHELAESPEDLGRRFDELCLQHGQDLTVHLGNDRIAGRCAGVGTDGALLLDTAMGRKSFLYGTLR